MKPRALAPEQGPSRRRLRGERAGVPWHRKEPGFGVWLFPPAQPRSHCAGTAGSGAWPQGCSGHGGGECLAPPCPMSCLMSTLGSVRGAQITCRNTQARATGKSLLCHRARVSSTQPLRCFGKVKGHGGQHGAWQQDTLAQLGQEPGSPWMPCPALLFLYCVCPHWNFPSLQ